MKSTSGFVLAIEGENSFALLGWGSKKQKVISRSTTESEFCFAVICFVPRSHSDVGGMAKVDSKYQPSHFMRTTLRV